MVELVIPAAAGNTRFNFLDIPQLRSDVEKDIVVTSIETYPVEAIPVDFNGNPVAPIASLQKGSLTLYVDQEESIFRIPLLKLLSLQNFANTWFGMAGNLTDFNNIQVDWTKSYVSTPTAFGNGAQMAFVFGVTYMRLAPGTMASIRKAKGAGASQYI